MPSRRRLLVIQLRPEDDVADDEFQAFLRYGNIALHDVVRLRVETTGVPRIDLDAWGAILVGGSPFDVSTPDALKSPVQRTLEHGFMQLLEDVVARDVPFLGACSGSGLLGRFCGVGISRKYAEPVGGVDVALTAEGRRDPLLAGLPSPFRALVGHKEACDDVPAGACLLASSATCPIQMFRLKHHVYATQFHPEGDPEGFALRIRAYCHHGYFPPDTAGALIAAVSAEQTPVAQQILGRFVQRYCG